MLPVYIVLSILAGATIVAGRFINSTLAVKIGTFQSTLINYVVGLFFSILFLFISNEALTITYANLKTIPFWAYLGGLLGIVVIVLSNFITPRISAFYLTLLVFIGQLFVGSLIDYFAFHDMSVGKIVGGFFVLFGLTFNLWIDKKDKVVTS